MNNQSKKLKNLRENNDSIFQELFGFGKKKADGPFYENDDIIIDSQLRLLLKKTNSTIEKPLPTAGKWSELDWNSTELNWLDNAVFKAQSASIAGNKIEQFRNCIWKSGDFRGGKFIGGEFDGGTFVGQLGPGAKWNTSPFNFVDGTTRETETILGIPNLTNLRKDRFSFNFISVPPSCKMSIELQNGVVHTISVVKRLDSKNNLFSYNVTNGITKETKSVNLRWGQIRGQNSSEFKSNTVFTTTSIPDIFTNIFGLKFESPIKMLTVDIDTNFEAPKWSEKEETPKELATKQFFYELNKIPILGINQIQRPAKSLDSPSQLFFNFTSSDEKKGFENVINFINKGWLNSYVKTIKKGLDNGIITGAPSNMPYLANLIEKQDGITSENIDKNIYNSLLGLDMFLKYFVDNIVLRARKSGPNRSINDISDEVAKNFIKNKIKSMLGKMPAATAAPVAKNAPKKKIKKLNIPESKVIVDNIHKILSERLKHL